jgi:membrane protease YdiL (CAAX protease family)
MSNSFCSLVGVGRVHVGGVVFALAYEKEKNLLVPIVIHISGNLAIFALSLPAH